MDVQEIRKQYPQYADLPDDKLAKGFHDKFYSDMPYETFAQKIGLRSVESRIPDKLAAPYKETAIKTGSQTIGDIEALGTMGSGTVGNIIGAVAGAGHDLIRGDFHGGSAGEETRHKVANALTYRPKSQEGEERLQQIADFMDATKLAGLPPVDGVSLASLAPQVASQGARTANRLAEVTRGTLNDIRASRQPAMAGMGSAMTDVEKIRADRAANIPRPNDLTKGQASRDFEQMQFERETAKNGEKGGDLRQRFAKQNENVLGSFDDIIDETGARAPTINDAGKTVVSAIERKAAAKKKEVDAAYTKAREIGAMNEPVDIEPIMNSLSSKRAKAQSINAGVISSARKELEAIAGPQKKDVFGQPIPRTVSINDLEEVRKSVGEAALKDATNGLHGKRIKNAIDQVLEDVGGEEYKYARKLRTQYGNEFENVGTVDKLLSTKPGTKDRSVAYEDVFKHSVLDGSLDDVRAIRRTLQTGGEQGQQAWKELQGQTLEHIKEQITKNMQVNSAGQRVVSPASLDKLVSTLDKDGKLDFMFGKKGADKIRNLRDHAIDIYTAPPDSVNFSNSASAMVNALNGLSGATRRVPLVHWGAEKIAQKVADAQLQNRIRANLNPEAAGQRKSISLRELADLSQRK